MNFNDLIEKAFAPSVQRQTSTTPEPKHRQSSTTPDPKHPKVRANWLECVIFPLSYSIISGVIKGYTSEFKVSFCILTSENNKDI